MRHLFERVVAAPLIFGVAVARAEDSAQQLMCVAQQWLLPSYLTELAGFIARQGLKIACVFGLHDLQPWATIVDTLENLARMAA